MSASLLSIKGCANCSTRSLLVPACDRSDEPNPCARSFPSSAPRQSYGERKPNVPRPAGREEGEAWPNISWSSFCAKEGEGGEHSLAPLGGERACGKGQRDIPSLSFARRGSGEPDIPLPRCAGRGLGVRGSETSRRSALREEDQGSRIFPRPAVRGEGEGQHRCRHRPSARRLT
jgi:hypothetical protein